MNEQDFIGNENISELPWIIGKEKRTGFCLGLLLIVFYIIAYQIVTFNRYLPVQEGWFQFYVQEIMNGKVMYRDFYMFIQPLYTYQMAFITNIFGNDFIVYRLYGIFERIIIGSVLYVILNYFFRPKYSFIAAVTSFMVYASSQQDIVYSYYQTCLLYSILMLYYALKLYDSFLRNKNNTWMLAILIGILGSFSFLCKQTLGLLVPIIIIFYLGIFLYKKNRPRAIHNLVLIIISYVVPISICYSWLYIRGAFPFYINQVFGGSSSKGSIGTILFGFLPRMVTLDNIILLSLFLVIVFLAYLVEVFIHRWLIKYKPARECNTDSLVIYMFLFTVVACISICYFEPTFSYYIFTTAKFLYCKRLLVHLTFYFTVIFIVWIGVGYYIKKGQSEFNIRLLLVVLFSVCVFYTHGLSGILEEHSVLPALGVLICMILTIKTPWPRFKNILVITLCLIVISLCSVQRFNSPYLWWGWQEPPVYMALEKSQLSQLKGLYLSHNTNETITDITETINDNTTINDTVFTFPHILIFNYLTERDNGLFAKVHYFDVCPDNVAKEDAIKLSDTPPKIIVWLNLTEEEWSFHENRFRGGNMSGQRLIKEVVEGLIKQGIYGKRGTFENIDVWVRLN